jgi:regulatory LuxR family protein
LIAAELDISEGTVKTHMKSILPKLNASDRTHAVMIALKRGILDLWSPAGALISRDSGPNSSVSREQGRLVRNLVVPGALTSRAWAIHHIQQAEPATICQLTAHEVHRPPLVGHIRSFICTAPHRQLGGWGADWWAMRWLSNLPGRSLRLMLYNSARIRLTTTSGKVASLSDAWLASATKEINQISADIVDANSSDAIGAASVPSAAAAIDGAAAASSTAGVFLADAVARVDWSGDFSVFAGGSEKPAFAAQLLAFGHCPSDFRVFVRRLLPQVSGDTRLSYAVQVTQLENGVSLREAHYVGGDGADWVGQFTRCAAADFPSALKPGRVSASSGWGWSRRH